MSKKTKNVKENNNSYNDKILITVFANKRLKASPSETMWSIMSTQSKSFETEKILNVAVKLH